MNFNLIAFLKLKGINNSCRKTNGETVTPFGYLHERLISIAMSRNSHLVVSSGLALTL